MSGRDPLGDDVAAQGRQPVVDPAHLRRQLGQSLLVAHDPCRRRRRRCWRPSGPSLREHRHQGRLGPLPRRRAARRPGRPAATSRRRGRGSRSASAPCVEGQPQRPAGAAQLRRPRRRRRPRRPQAAPSPTKSRTCLAEVADAVHDRVDAGRRPASRAASRRTGRPPTGSSVLGTVRASGHIRLPRPPARITHCTDTARSLPDEHDAAVVVEAEPHLGQPLARAWRPAAGAGRGVEQQEAAGTGTDQLAAAARRGRGRPRTSGRCWGWT